MNGGATVAVMTLVGHLLPELRVTAQAAISIAVSVGAFAIGVMITGFASVLLTRHQHLFEMKKYGHLLDMSEKDKKDSGKFKENDSHRCIQRILFLAVLCFCAGVCIGVYGIIKVNDAEPRQDAGKATSVQASAVKN